ncbi:MAG: hypothetical protein KDB80_06475, partial [Planctomycetes bacterium]|nr:hypothetical protein [Planctomycetota bacterium]
WLSRQYLLVGVVPLQGFPLPTPFATGCAAWVLPLTTGHHDGVARPWSLAMPRPPPGMHVHLQGVNEYFTTIDSSIDLQTTDGLDLTVL